MQAGKLDRQIRIERQTETVSPSGSVRKTWQPLTTVWAEMLQNAAVETLTGFGEVETGSIVFRTRYLAGITTADRIIYEGGTYNLKDIREIGRRNGLELKGTITR